jgi:hypothetical protein
MRPGLTFIDVNESLAAAAACDRFVLNRFRPLTPGAAPEMPSTVDKRRSAHKKQAE